MIDVVFFLLVFFMMASLSMATYRGLPVNLPQAATGREGVPDGATITVTREGQTFLDKEPVALPALAQRLRGMAAGKPGFAVIVNADDAVAHGRVVAVLDEVRGAGVGRLAIAIRPVAGSAVR
jgi:biopolymer transport protein ExbD